MLEANGTKAFHVCRTAGCVASSASTRSKASRLPKAIVGLAVHWSSRGIGICREGLAVWLTEAPASLWCSCKSMS